jgi:hypothetical protein
MKMRLTLLSAALLLAGCQTNSTVRDVAGKDQFTQLTGASLILNQALPIRAGQARVFVQGGRVSTGFNSYRPSCGFEIGSVQHGGVEIEPDTFAITSVQGSLTPVVSTEPMRFAALNLAGAEGLDGGSQAYYQGYHFWLSSEQQPDVRRMTCYGVYAEPYELYPPTLAEIREALGTIAEIRQ